jgi:hypothetical protein
MIFRYIVVLFLSINVCIAQIEIEESFQQNRTSFLNTISSDALYSVDNTIKLIQSPLNFDGNDLIFAGFILGMTGASFNIDNDIRHDILKTRNKNLDEIMYYGEKFGRPIYATFLSALLYSTGLITSNDHMKETGQILAEAMICTGIFTKLLKVTMGRARPFTG